MYIHPYIKKVNYRFDATKTFVVFPDARKKDLRINVVKKQIEKELGGVKLKLMSEIIQEAKQVLKK